VAVVLLGLDFIAAGIDLLYRHSATS